MPVLNVGTTATIDPLPQLMICALTGDTAPIQSPNFTVLVPCVVPKPVPVSVTWVPVIPDPWDNVEITGAASAGRLDPIKTQNMTATVMTINRERCMIHLWMSLHGKSIWARRFLLGETRRQPEGWA